MKEKLTDLWLMSAGVLKNIQKKADDEVRITINKEEITIWLGDACIEVSEPKFFGVE